MSKIKAFICTILLFIVIAALFITITFIEPYGINLFRIITSCVTGLYLGDKLGSFYFWLSK